MAEEKRNEIILAETESRIDEEEKSRKNYLKTRTVQEGVFEGCLALVEASGTDYKVTSPLTGAQIRLTRDVDFGVIPRTKQPSLFKSGAEKVCMAYGLMQRFTIESKIEQISPEPFFMYTVVCELVKISSSGQEYVFGRGYGSGNTKEKRNGFNGAFDAANSTLKMAQKRALVQAALSISGLSSMFSQDIENESFMANYDELVNKTKAKCLTTKQVQRIYAIANDIGIGGTAAQNKITAKYGYTKASEIPPERYDEICEWLNSLKTEEK